MSETTRPRTASHEAADAFLARYTAGTLAIYTLDLRLLFEWCATAGLEPLDLKRPHLERFMRHLAAPIADGGRANGPTAIARRMRAIRGYYRLAVADDLIDRDPSLMLRMPTVHREPERLVWLDRFQVGALLRTAQGTSPDHHALIGLLAAQGLRVSAACAADFSDLTQTASGLWQLSVREKGGRIHTRPVSPELIAIIETVRDGRTEGPIIRRRNGQAHDRGSAYAWVRQLGHKAGLGHVHPHALRRAGVRAVIDSGASIQTARDFAGHAQTSTTELYDYHGGVRGIPGSLITGNLFASVS